MARNQASKAVGSSRVNLMSFFLLPFSEFLGDLRRLVCGVPWKEGRKPGCRRTVLARVLVAQFMPRSSLTHFIPGVTPTASLRLLVSA